MSMDMNKLMKQAQQMQEQMAKAQEEAATTIVEGSAGGMVSVKATAAGEVLEIKIAKEAIDPDDAEMLEDLVLAAVNNALHAAEAAMQAKMGPLMGGLGLGM